MKNKVYWSLRTPHKVLNLLSKDIVPLTKELKEGKNTYKGNTFNNEYRRCPAFSEYIKNTYVVKAPCDITIVQIQDNAEFSLYLEGKTQSYYDDIMQITNYEKEQTVQLLWLWTLISESPNTTVTQLPPLFHPSDYSNNVTPLPGIVNISKWFRPIQPAFIMNRDKIIIKEGDALFYLKFNHKVNLEEYRWTDTLHEFMNECISIKDYIKFMPLKKLYQLFDKKRIKRRILNIIKK